MSISATATRDASPATRIPLAIRLLRRCNPLIAGILRSPLHHALSRNLLLLSYRGRRSGRRYTLPLSYVTIGPRLYLCTRSSRWCRNLRGGAAVDVVLRGARLRAHARVLDADSPEALDALRLFLTRNPRTGELLYDVRRGDDGRPVEADLGREVHRSTVVRVEARVA